MKQIISQKEKRFLIILISICSFALLCNIAPIKGTVYKGQKFGFKPAIYLFTTGDEDYLDDFWPFNSSFINHRTSEYNTYGNLDFNEDGKYGVGFYGIFNGFDYLEFFVYVLVGIVVIFIPKIW